MTGRPTSGTAVAGSASRVVAWRALRRVHRDGAWASQAVDRELRAGDLDARDRAFATNLAFSTLRWQGTLDWALAQVVRRPLPDVEPALLDVLRIGAWQLLYGQVPDRAAVSTAVDTARAVLPARTAGFVNGVLRALARRRDALAWPSTDTDEGLGLALGYPAWVVGEARRRFGDGARAELEAGNVPAPLTVRTTHRDDRAAALTAVGLSAEPTTWAPDGLRVAGATPTSLMARFGDRLVIQDEASMLVVAALAAAVDAPAVDAPGWVLDACAAPGGKATHLAQRGLRVVAADRHERRARLVAELAARLSLSVDVVVADAARAPWAAGAFAGVLVDAPCTGLGVVRRRPELRWRRDVADPAALAAVQAGLLDGVAGCVAPGGVLAYSVCTWTAPETVEVVEAFLRRHRGFSVEPPRVAVDSAVGGVGLQLGTARHGTDGMYLALLRRAV